MRTNLTPAEIKALTPAQRAKYRKITKAYEDTLNPIRSAKIKLEADLRRAAYDDLNIDERIKAVETPIREEMAEIDRLRSELWEKWTALSKRLSDETLEIQAETYQAAYNHPQVQALSEIWQTINETHAKALEEFTQAADIESEVA